MASLRDIFSFLVTQPYGPTDVAQEPAGHGYQHFHTGVDLALPEGTPVPAEGSGTVETIFQDAIGGQQVKVKYASGAEGWFAHLRAILVRPGQHVDPATEIGESGHTGGATGPHLHFEERDPMGQLIDPFTAQARTYIGGLAVAHEDDGCPPGYHRAPFGCAPDTIPGSLSPLPGLPDLPSGTNPLELPNPFSPVGAAIDRARADLARGTKELAVAGVVMGVVAVVGISGAKKVLG